MNSNFLRIWITASGIMTLILGLLTLIFVFFQTSGRFSWHRIGEMIFAVIVATSGVAGYSGAKSLNAKGLGMFILGSLLAAIVFFCFSGFAFSSSQILGRKIQEFELVAGIAIILGLFFIHNIVTGAIQLASTLKNSSAAPGNQSIEMGRNSKNDDLGKYFKQKNEKK